MLTEFNNAQLQGADGTGGQSAASVDSVKARMNIALYSVLVTALFGLTFIPHTLKWRVWHPWLQEAVYILAVIGGCVVACQIGSLRRLLERIGAGVKYTALLPDSVLIEVAAIGFFCLTYFLSGALFDHFPAEVDSMAQYAGAKIFAQGHFTLPSHPLQHFFDTSFFINDGKFYTFYPPGHMMILAAGHLFGNPAVINPFLGSLSLVAVYFLTKEVGGISAAKISLLFFLGSPFIVFLSSEYDNRSTALLTATLFTLFYIRAIKHNLKKDALFTGIAIGYLFITRPQTAIFFVLPFAVHGVWRLSSRFQRYWKYYALMLFGGVPFILFFLYYNWQTTGDPFLTGYQQYFGANVLPGSRFTSLEGWGLWPEHFTQLVKHTQLLHSQLFGWPVSSLFLIFILFISNAQKRFGGLLVAVFFVVCFGLTLTDYIYDIFGPRYLYETSGLLIVLTAISVQRLPAIFRKFYDVKITPNTWRGLITVTLCGLISISFFTKDVQLYELYSNNYRGSNLGFLKWVQDSVQIPAVALIQDNWEYNQATFTQPPDEKSSIIFAHDRGKKNEKILRYFSERSVYVVRQDDKGHDTIKRLQ